MTKFESGVKVVPASQEAVYEKLSDLSNLDVYKRQAEKADKRYEYGENTIVHLFIYYFTIYYLLFVCPVKMCIRDSPSLCAIHFLMLDTGSGDGMKRV